MAAELELWTDGSGIATGGEPIGWGWVLVARKDGQIAKTRCGGGCGHDGTNNRAELMAVIEGLRTLTKPVAVTVFTDSEYVAKPFRMGTIVKWMQNVDMDGNWRLLSGKKGPVKNQDLWELLVAECDRHVVSWELVKGHAGHEHNERADRIAGVCRRALKAELEGEA